MKKPQIFLALLCLCFTACQDKSQYFEDAICFEHVSTIDAKSGLQADQTVVVQGEKIIKISPSKDLVLSKKNTIIDGANKFLIPGLWDAHVHFAYIEELAPSMFDLFLAYGITSVRDTGGKIEVVKKWKDKALADSKNAPRVMIAGPLLDGKPTVYDGSDPKRPALGKGVGSPENAIRMVNHLDSMGVDFLKAYEMLSPEEFDAIAKIAKAKGLQLTGHVPLSMDVITASNKGLNSIEHLRNIEMSTTKDANVLLQKRRELLASGKLDNGYVLRKRVHAAQRQHAIENADEAQTQKVLDALAKNQTWQIPTFMVMVDVPERPFGMEAWKASFKYLPDALEKKWMEGFEIYANSEVSEGQEKYSNWMFDMTKKMNDADIGIMAGTDCPIYFLTPGYSLHAELALLVKAGLTPMEALETATLRPAQYFKMENQLGLIAEGMFADLILLDANPLDDISNTQKINAVVKEGKLFSRANLDEMLEKLEGK